MTRAQKGLIIFVVALTGLWGCSQGEHKPGGTHEARLKALEARCAALESECKAVMLSRDTAHKKLAEMEKDRTRLLRELDHYRAVAQECDSLKALITARTAERDAANCQLEEARKSIRDIRTIAARLESVMLPPEDAAEKSATSPKL